MKKILVPFDFSEVSINAYRFALDAASTSNGEVQLINVIELPVLQDVGAMSGKAFENTFLSELKEKATTKIQEIIDKYKPQGVKVTWNITSGVPSRTIIDFVNDQHIDLVIMGSHGARGLREYLIGSNAEKVIRKSPVPVIIIKDYSKRAIKNIVFPNTLELYDQDDLVMKVKTLQQFFKAQLHVVWINTPLTFTPDVITLESLKSFAKHHDLTEYTLNIYNHRTEEEGTLEFTKLIKGDIIAIGTHSRTGLSRLINGSLTEDVANHSDTIVWSYTMKNEPIGGQV